MMRDCDVLIVASRHSREVDGVIDGLRQQRLTVDRFTPCQFPEHDMQSWGAGGSGVRPAKVRAAWLADFGGWSVERTLTGLAREAAIAEAAAFAEGVLLTLDARWLNSPMAVRASSRKLFQLRRASSLGIRVPRTCATNSGDVARKFVADVGHAIVKSIANAHLTYGTQSIKFYTREIGADSNKVFDSLRFSPLIFQERVEKLEEVRVTVVDDWAVGVRVDLSKASCPRPVDTRQLDYSSNRALFSKCADRPDLLVDSTKIARELGLSYSGVDWAIDSAGQAYFLECNAMGAFKWSERCSGENITGRLVEALARRCGTIG
jgi:glutathione synthase/RimK-type ligase-like ATP-grasp enzyme